MQAQPNQFTSGFTTIFADCPPASSRQDDEIVGEPAAEGNFGRRLSRPLKNTARGILPVAAVLERLDLGRHHHFCSSLVTERIFTLDKP